MRRLILTPVARHDLAAPTRNLIQVSGSVATAPSFNQQLLDRCRRLTRLPGTLGTPRPEYGADVRAAFQGDYVIMFRYEPGTLRVLRVMEGHRDLVGRAGGNEH